MKRTVLSKRLTEIASIKKDKTLAKVNQEAGFGPNFIYRLWGRDNIELSTVNRIANVLGCSAFDILEEYEVIDEVPAPAPTATPARSRYAMPTIDPEQMPPAEAERRRALLAQAAGRSERGTNQ